MKSATGENLPRRKRAMYPEYFQYKGHNSNRLPAPLPNKRGILGREYTANNSEEIVVF